MLSDAVEELDEVDDEDALLLSLGGGGGAPPLRLWRSDKTLCAARWAVVVSPDFTALNRLFRSVRNWLDEDDELDDVSDEDDVPDVEDELLVALVPNMLCRSFETAVAADCALVVSPDCTDCRSVERSFMKLLAVELCED